MDNDFNEASRRCYNMTGQMLASRNNLQFTLRTLPEVVNW